MDKWYRVLVNLRYMVIALPGVQVLFIHIQEDLHHSKDKKGTLTKGVHQVVAYFRWSVQDLD